MSSTEADTQTTHKKPARRKRCVFRKGRRV
jgi:hypothetical protein